MKKIFFAVSLCLAAPFASADDVQLIVDSLNSQGFKGCQEAVRKISPFDVSHVETKVIFPDEAIVTYSQQSNGNWQDGIQSLVVRKMGKQCKVARNLGAIASQSKSCAQVADGRVETTQVAESGSLSWQGSRDQVARAIYAQLPDGRCRVVVLPY